MVRVVNTKDLGVIQERRINKLLSLSLNSQFTYSEMGNSEYPVPEKLI